MTAWWRSVALVGLCGLGALVLAGCEPNESEQEATITLASTLQVQAAFASNGRPILAYRSFTRESGVEGSETLFVNTPLPYGGFAFSDASEAVNVTPNVRGDYRVTGGAEHLWFVDTLKDQDQLHICAKPIVSSGDCPAAAKTPARVLHDLAPDGQGQAMLLYQLAEGGPLQSLQIAGDGQWTGPVELPDSATLAHDGVRLGIGPGSTLALWQRDEGAAVLASVFDRSATRWGLPQQLAAASTSAPLLVSARPDGGGSDTSVALWSTALGVEGAVYHPQLGWQTLDAAPGTAGAALAAADMSDQGDTLVVWTRLDTGHAYAAHLMNGQWGAAIDLGPATSLVRVAGDGRGNHAVVLGDTSLHLRVHRYLAGSGWQPALPVADHVLVDTFDAAADANGLVVIGYAALVSEPVGNSRFSSQSLQLDGVPVHVAVTLDNAGSVVSEPAGIDCPGTCEADFLPRSRVAMRAAPTAGGGSFLSWNVVRGTSTSTTSDNPLSINLDLNITDPRLVTAHFGAAGTATAALTVQIVGAGHVTATGIDCGADCSETFPLGTTVVLTTTADAGQHFGGWTGDADCSDGSVRMDANRACTATFLPDVPQVLLNVIVDGAGLVSSSPVGIACSGSCSALFASGSVVTLTAAPGANTAVSWSGPGGCSGTATSVQITLTTAATCRATFTAISPGAGWTMLGGSPDVAAVTGRPAIATDAAGLPTIAYTVEIGEVRQLLVRRLAGTQWAMVGLGPVSDTLVSAYAPSLALDNEGRPIVAWFDARAKIHVRHWSGSAWENLGDDLAVNPGAITSLPQVAVAGTQVVLAWNEFQGTTARLALKRRALVAGSWAGDFVPGISSASDMGLRLALDPAGLATVLVRRYATASGELPLSVLQESATGWAPLCGNVGTGSGQANSNDVIGYGLQLADDGSARVVQTRADFLAVQAWHCDGTAWSTWGPDDGNVLRVDNVNEFLQGMAMAAAGAPTLAVQINTGYAGGQRIEVFRAGSGGFESVGPGLALPRKGTYSSLAVAPAAVGSPVVVFGVELGVNIGLEVHRYTP